MELKTKKTGESVTDFIAGIEDEHTREDSRRLVKMMSRVTGEQPRMWGSAIVGFGDRHYTYASGREGDWFKIGFSPRRQNLTLYLMDYVEEENPLLARLGKHTTGKSCLYVRRLDDVDLEVLETLVTRSYEALV